MNDYETHVNSMTPAQFEAYRRALQEIDFSTLPPTDQEHYIAMLRAVNARRSRELAEPLTVTVREGAARTLPLSLLAAALIATILFTRH